MFFLNFLSFFHPPTHFFVYFLLSYIILFLFYLLAIPLLEVEAEKAPFDSHHRIATVNFTNIFYEQLLHWYSFDKKWQSQTVSRKKLQKHFCTKIMLIKCWWNRHLVSTAWFAVPWLWSVMIPIPKTWKKRINFSSQLFHQRFIPRLAAIEKWSWNFLDAVKIFKRSETYFSCFLSFISDFFVLGIEKVAGH